MIKLKPIVVIIILIAFTIVHISPLYACRLRIGHAFSETNITKTTGRFNKISDFLSRLKIKKRTKLTGLITVLSVTGILSWFLIDSFNDLKFTDKNKNFFVSKDEKTPVFGNTPVINRISSRDSTYYVNILKDMLLDTLGNEIIEFEDCKINLGEITVEHILTKYTNSIHLLRLNFFSGWIGKAYEFWPYYAVENADTTYMSADEGSVLIENIKYYTTPKNRIQDTFLHELTHIALGCVKVSGEGSFESHVSNLLHKKYGFSTERTDEIEAAIEEFICYNNDIKFLRSTVTQKDLLATLRHACEYRQLIPNEIFDKLKYEPSYLYNTLISEGYVKNARFTKDNTKLKIGYISSDCAVISWDFIDWESDSILEDPASFMLKDSKNRLTNLKEALTILYSKGFVSEEIKKGLKNGIMIFDGDKIPKDIGKPCEIQIHTEMLKLDPHTLALFTACGILHFVDTDDKMGKLYELIGSFDKNALRAIDEDLAKIPVRRLSLTLYPDDVYLEKIFDSPVFENNDMENLGEVVLDLPRSPAHASL